jgi:hypothetical protein
MSIVEDALVGVEATFAKVWAYLDSEILTPANTWLWTHVSPARQYLALI